MQNKIKPSVEIENSKDFKPDLSNNLNFMNKNQLAFQSYFKESRREGFN